MFNPLRRLKHLPWIPLLQAALVTILMAIAVDLLISLSFTLVPSLVPPIAQLLYSPLLGIVIVLAIAAGIGALGVVVLERWFRQVILTNTTLWAFVPCLALWLGLTAVMPFPLLLIPKLSYITVVAVILGVFWKGRRYWR